VYIPICVYLYIYIYVCTCIVYTYAWVYMWYYNSVQTPIFFSLLSAVGTQKVVNRRPRIYLFFIFFNDQHTPFLHRIHTHVHTRYARPVILFVSILSRFSLLFSHEIVFLFRRRRRRGGGRQYYDVTAADVDIRWVTLDGIIILTCDLQHRA